MLRRLLRRAVRHGMRLGFEEPFLCRLLPVVGEAMAGAYPELAATRGGLEATVRAEEEKFLATVAIGVAAGAGGDRGGQGGRGDASSAARRSSASTTPTACRSS